MFFHHFNSHPHEEDDDRYLKLRSYDLHISTHILTKRMTKVIQHCVILLCISTHILTKRMTEKKMVINMVHIISTHILTKRMTATLIFAWQKPGISTHILTKRMTMNLYSSIVSVQLFQLTSSRRG